MIDSIAALARAALMQIKAGQQGAVAGDTEDYATVISAVQADEARAAMNRRLRALSEYVEDFVDASMSGKLARRTLRGSVFIALCLASVAARAQGHGGGGGHSGGGWGHSGGGWGHSGGGGHFAGAHASGGHAGRAHGAGHFGGYYYDYGGGHVLLGLGYWPWYYPPAYYYYPYYPQAVAPAAPPVYVERADEQAAPQSAYWYYCADTKGYYPYVTQCAGGWQRVSPQPPPPS